MVKRIVVPAKLGMTTTVIPAKAGIQFSFRDPQAKNWMPACAGMTAKWRSAVAP